MQGPTAPPPSSLRTRLREVPRPKAVEGPKEAPQPSRSSPSLQRWTIPTCAPFFAQSTATPWNHTYGDKKKGKQRDTVRVPVKRTEKKLTVTENELPSKGIVKAKVSRSRFTEGINRGLFVRANPLLQSHHRQRARISRRCPATRASRRLEYIGPQLVVPWPPLPDLMTAFGAPKGPI